MHQRRFPNAGVNINPMDNRIRTAKVIAERLPGFNAHNLFCVYRIHHRDVIGKNSTLTGDFPHAKAVQSRECIRPELNTRANFTNLVRFLQQHHFNALTGQR